MTQSTLGCESPQRGGGGLGGLGCDACLSYERTRTLMVTGMHVVFVRTGS